MISLLIFCLIESKSLCIWVLGLLALVVALILLPLYLCCFKIYFIRYKNCNSCFLFIYLFLLSIWLVNLSPSLCFESLHILAYETGLDVTCRWVLAVSFDWGDLVDLNLGLLPFDVNWLFYPFIDVNSSLC